MKTVSIWAPLRYANYGDDLQAIIMAKYIQSLGYNVYLFQLDEELSRIYNLKSVSNLDDLCKDVNLCIIAGGALLTPISIPKQILHKSSREYEKDFRDLYSITKKYPTIKFCAISMGGDGNTHRPFNSFGVGRVKFFSCSNFINGSVRLPGDTIQMNVFGKEFVYYPDMLMKTKDYSSPKMLSQTKKYRVGFNFKKGKYLDKNFINDVFQYAETHDDIEFYFTTTHMLKKNMNYQYVPERESKNIFIKRYENPDQLLGILASMDIFITSMLHLGITGLVMGTPFISYRGPGKTKTFLRTIGGEWAITDDKVSFKELKERYFSQSKTQLFSAYNISKIQNMTKESIQHYELCKRIITEFA